MHSEFFNALLKLFLDITKFLAYGEDILSDFPGFMHYMPVCGWKKHTQWHWSKDVLGKRLDFWPTKDKWQYEGRIYFGDVDKFIAHIAKARKQKLAQFYRQIRQPIYPWNLRL